MILNLYEARVLENNASNLHHVLYLKQFCIEDTKAKEYYDS